MKGLNDAYVDSIIRKSKDGKLTTGQAAAKLGITKQYVNRLKRAYAEKAASAFGGRVWIDEKWVRSGSPRRP